MKSIKFIKKVDSWYIDLPLYDGDNADLLIPEEFHSLISEFTNKDNAIFLLCLHPDSDPDVYAMKIYESKGWAYYRAYLVNDRFRIKSFDLSFTPIVSWKFDRVFPEQIWMKYCG